MTVERWLVTGASGQLGGHVVAQLVRDTRPPDVLALTGKSRCGVESTARQSIDLSDDDAIRGVVRTFRPTHVIHLAAVTAVGEAYTNPRHAARVNTHATRTLAESAAEVGARLVFSSTDMVFDGQRAPYRESDPPAPLSVYGRTKADAEAALAGVENVVVVRLPLMYGFALGGRGNTFAQQIEALRSGQSLRLFTDEFRTPIWLPDAAAAVVGLARSDFCGLIHVAGPQRLSRCAMVERFAELLGIDSPAFERISRLSIEAAEPRPADLSLDAARFGELFPKLTPGPIRAEIFA